MSNPGGGPLAFGRVAGHRGGKGEITVHVASGEAERWTGLREVLVGSELLEIEDVRAYAGKLVLKLKGFDEPSRAAALKGLQVAAPAGEVPNLPEGRYWVSRLIGARVADEAGEEIGLVEDVVETGGTDLLVVRDASGHEVLVPMAREIVRGIDEAGGRIRVRLPEGLRELNRIGAADERAES